MKKFVIAGIISLGLMTTSASALSVIQGEADITPIEIAEALVNMKLAEMKCGMKQPASSESLIIVLSNVLGQSLEQTVEDVALMSSELEAEMTTEITESFCKVMDESYKVLESE